METILSARICTVYAKIKQLEERAIHYWNGGNNDYPS
jgi:hypothetical protein